MALKTETDTPEMQERVAKAFLAHVAGAQYREEDWIAVVFEHGQWWVEIVPTGEQFSVVDAEGGDSSDGFDFEQVTQGDDR